jgi:hypothetical protein
MSIETQLEDTARRCLGLVLEDELWVALGWKRRPKYGSVTQRFRSRWKVNLEKTCLKELLILLTASEIKRQGLGTRGVEKLVSLYVDGTKGSRPLWPSLGYNSRDEASLHLRESIEIYLRAALQEWDRLALERVGLRDIPDAGLMGRLAIGTTRVVQNLVSLTVENPSSAS